MSKKIKIERKKGEKAYEKNYEETKITSLNSMASGNRNVIRIRPTGSQPEMIRRI